MSESSDEMTYEEYILQASLAPINDARLLVTDAVEQMWEPHMPGACRAFCEAQFEAMQEFCKVIRQTYKPGTRDEPAYDELLLRAYAMLSDVFRRHGRHLSGQAFQMLLADFNNRIVINFYLSKEPGEEYEYRTVVMALDALPIELMRTPQYDSFQLLRHTHEHTLSLIH